jgi:hypothetical protein
MVPARMTATHMRGNEDPYPDSQRRIRRTSPKLPWKDLGPSAGPVWTEVNMVSTITAELLVKWATSCSITNLVQQLWDPPRHRQSHLIPRRRGRWPRLRTVIPTRAIPTLRLQCHQWQCLQMDSLFRHFATPWTTQRLAMPLYHRGHLSTLCQSLPLCLGRSRQKFPSSRPAILSPRFQSLI